MSFTHKYWNELCLFFLDHSNVVSVAQYFKNPNLKTPIILKHDVEHDIDLALIIGEIEYKAGISSTFYLQFDVAISNPRKVIQLKNMGHDIGYHYDVLDANNGDYEVAMKQFQIHLEAFSDMGIEIKSVCPHGNPIKIRSGWTSNKDFFRSDEVRKAFPDMIDIVVDREEIFPEELWYVSDAGYTFKLISDISNNDRVVAIDKNIAMPDDLPIKKCTILISTHPHRWMNSKYMFYIKKSVFIVSRIIARSLSQIGFLKPIFNSLYHIARRF
tara:strand:+ start:356 stop:1168 length:813 start_codon:yes stop_codon:yes gene_type:complete